jgi:RND family efflux transporter MFP subunit
MNRVLHSSLAVGTMTAAVLAANACSRPRAEGTASTELPTVAVARVTRGDVAQVLTVTADFRPFQEIDVHAKVAGYLKSINVDVGDRVHAGQLLAVLEIPELQDDLQQAEAGVHHAQEEINRAQADFERAESAHEVAHLGATRLSSVLKARPNLVAQQDIDEATGRDRVAEAQVATAKASIASARQQLSIAQANQNKTKTLYAYAQITAPFAGVITHRYADTGAMIQAGTSSQTQAMPLVRLSQNSRLRLVIPVPESAVSRIRIGSPVDLHVQSLHKTFTGSVARFSDRLDVETRTMHVEVDVPNANLELVPGMYADASIVLNEAKNVLVAPVESIDRTQKAPSVLVVNRDHKLEPRDVRIGLESGERVEIASGVSADDLLVVGNRSQLKPGTVVSPKVMEPRTSAEGVH